jgi:hypothetical protein
VVTAPAGNGYGELSIGCHFHPTFTHLSGAFRTRQTSFRPGSTPYGFIACATGVLRTAVLSDGTRLGNVRVATLCN